MLSNPLKSLIFLSKALCFLLLASFLVSCGNSKTHAYGDTVRFELNRFLNYPDFSVYIQHLHTLNIETPDAGDTYEVTVTSRTKQDDVLWKGSIQKIKPYAEFTLAQTTYFIQLEYVDTDKKKQKYGELVIWTSNQYQDKYAATLAEDEKEVLNHTKVNYNTYDSLTPAPTKERDFLARYTEYLVAIKSEDVDTIEDLSTNQHFSSLDISDEVEGPHTDQLITKLSKSRPNPAALTLISADTSSQEATLQLLGGSLRGTQAIGVKLTKERNEWKVDEEMVLPNNKPNRVKIRRFLHAHLVH